MAFNIGSALELNRTRYQKPVATLAASATSVAAGKYTKKFRSKIKPLKPSFDARKEGALNQAQNELEILQAKEISEPIEFGPAARVGFQLLILINAIGDILDLAILFGGVTEILSLVTDVTLAPINLYFLGLSPKQQKLDKQALRKVMIRFVGVENIPIVSIFYLRTRYVYKVYQARKRAAEGQY